MTELDDLDRRFGIPDEVRFKASDDLGGPVVEITNRAARGLIALKGAQVLSWTPEGRAPVLWLSPLARLDQPKSMRGGIPVCWPWFADHPSDPSRPFHGIARIADWDVVAVSSDGETTRVTLTLPDRANAALPLRPRLDVEIGHRLRVTLTTLNGGATPVTLTEALHTYFAVSDVAEVTLDGLDGATYLDKVDAFARKSQSGPVRFDGETDRIYLSGGLVRITDPLLHRTISVRSEGSGATVVWNPAAERARNIADIPEGGWRCFVCAETANAADAAVIIGPGASHELVAEITVD